MTYFIENLNGNRITSTEQPSITDSRYDCENGESLFVEDLAIWQTNWDHVCNLATMQKKDVPDQILAVNGKYNYQPIIKVS